MVDEIEIDIMDEDNRLEPDVCGDCVFYMFEECDCAIGSIKGRKVYDDTPKCDRFDPITNA